MPRLLLFLISTLLLRPETSQQVTGQDLDKILERADKLLEEAKSAYEEGRTRTSVSSFVDAGFKLEEARIKYLVLQEIGQGEKQKLAADRLRAVNQLNKLINNGKLAVSGGSEGPAPAKLPADSPAPAPEPAAVPLKVLADVTKRASVPEPGKQRDVEKTIRDLYKDQYAKKAPGDRLSLAKLLLEQADKTTDDPIGRWVLYREAQDLAAQAGDIRTAMQAVEAASAIYDVDPLTLKNGAIAATSKSAKASAEFAALAEMLIRLTDEFIGVDQYDQADKAAQAAGQHAKRSGLPNLLARTSSKTKEVADAKVRFASLKKTLENLAKDPEDAAANLEMGQFVCFVKASWDVGLRFLAKGSDLALKSAAERDIARPLEPAEQIAAGDAWWDLSEKAKVPGSKEKMQSRALFWYEAALPGTTGLTRAKIDRRLGEIYKVDEPPTAGLVGRWLFNEGAGTTVSDTSGNGNNGNLGGNLRWNSGVTGSALDFEGGGEVTCGTKGMPAQNGPLTIAWSMSLRSSADQIFVSLDDAASQAALSPGLQAGRVSVWTWAGRTTVSTPSPGNGWHQYAYTYDRTTHRLYVDGELKDSSTAPSQSAATKRLVFGRWVGGGGAGASGQFTGILDEIRIYTRVLSEAEIRSLLKQRK